ncbi:MAG: U32 family peptidase, partial [Clostridia bacterium]|nr:U32 family peptidase [Clostridia bacterium]
MELLSPAGNLEKLRAAINFGADAVYLSGPGFGLRAASTEFSPEALKEAVGYAHARGVKVYVTVNATPHENEYPALESYIDLLARIRPDGLIVSDPGVILLCRERLPEIPIHLST